MGRIATSIEIMKASLAVVRRDASLVWLPVVSFTASLITGGLFAGGIFLTTNRPEVIGAGGQLSTELQMTPFGYVLTGVMYLALAFITVFFNAALISGAHERLTGGDPTLGSALSGATARIGLVAQWALVSATVSAVLKSIQNRSGLLGRIAVGLVGMAWTLVTFLVLPVMVIEGLGVVEAVKRSKDLFKRTWGEQVVGSVSIGLVGFLAILPAILVVVLMAALGNVVLIGAAIVLAVLWIAAVMAVTTAMSGVFQTALYLYASTGRTPTGFEGPDLDTAFRPRNG